MRGQHPGISQPMHRQQSGCDDLQSLQQHLMYKQLQEFQRQQQLGQDQKQHLGISAISKHAIANHLATPVNGVPVNDKSNYLWQNELAGGDHKLQNSSQMSIIGNMCLAQDNGVTAMHGFSNGFLPSQDQALQLMGFVPQQSDQSFYGIPVSNTRSSSNHYSQVQGVSQDFSDVMTKHDVNQKQKNSLESASYNSFQNSQELYNDHSGHQHSILASNQDLHGKRILSHGADSANSNIAGDVSQVNSIERASQGHEFNIGHGPSDWTGNLQHKGASQPSSSHASVGLDPTEQRILFSSDDDWASFGSSSIMNMSGLHGSHSEGNDLINAFPPIQSGSWSALMQSAVAEASSSNMGLQDEWSGLTFQKVESSSGNHDAMMNDNVRQQNSWLSNNNASTLPSRTSSFGKVEQTHASHSNTERNHFNSHIMDESWDQQQNTPPYRFPSQPNDKENNWNMAALHSSSIEPSFRVPGNESSMHHDHMDGPIRCGITYKDHTATTWNTDGNQVAVSSPPTTGSEALKSVDCFSQGQKTVAYHSHSSKHFHEINTPELYRKGLVGGKFAAFDSSNFQGNESTRNNHQIPSKSPQLWESSLSNLDKLSGEIYDRKHEYGQRELSNESYMSTHSHPDHSSDSVGGARESHPLSASNSHSLANVSKNHSQVGNEMLTTKRYHHESMGNLMRGSEIKDLQQTAHSHNLAHMITRGSKVPDQRYTHESVPSNHLDPKMRHVNYSQLNEQGTAEISAKGDINGQECKTSVSFDESANVFLQSNQSGQASQRMLQLLRRVDESTEKNKDTSDGNILSKRNLPMVSDSFNEQSQQNQNSTFHGFGLRLSLPSERLSGSSSALSSHTSPVTIEKHNCHDHGLEVEDKRRAASSSTIPMQSVPLSHQVFRPHDWNASVASDQLTESNMQIGNDYVAGNSGETMYRRNQLNKQQQQQQISGASGSTIINHSGNQLFGAPYDSDKYSVNSQQQKNDSHVRASIASQSFTPDSSGRASPFALSSPDSSSHVVSHSCHLNMQSQSHPMTGDSLYKRIPGQQLHTPDAGQVSQHSLASLVPRIGGTVGTAHNVWADISNQHPSDSMFQHSINLAKRNTSFLNSNKTGNDDQKDGESKPLNFSGYCSIAQNLPYAQETPGSSKQHISHGKLDNTLQMTSSQGLESLPNQASDGSSSILKSSLIRGHQQNKEKQDIASPYSLLQQVQAMKAFETNPSIRSAKRFKETEMVSETEQFIGKPSQNIHGYNIVGKSSTESELNAVVHCNSFSSDSRMLSFSSEGVDHQNASKPQGVGQVLSRDTSTSRHNDSQNYPGSASVTPDQLSSEAHMHNMQINPQMASTWFQQYGNLTNGSVPAVFGGFQKSVQITDKHYFASNVSECVPTHNVLAIGNDAVQVKSALEGSSSTSTSANQLSSCQALSSVVLEPKLGMPKKRKSATSELFPWHKEITLGSERLQNIRMAERNWAQATNRLLEKVENEGELSDDRHPLLKARRRLVLTSQLMQLLLPAVPAVIFAQPARMTYGNVTYLVAKWTLGDACNLLCCSRKGAHGQLDGENMLYEKTEDREGLAVHFLKLLEKFVGRARKLETDLNRFDKRASALDVRVECQDLEKFSIINRFAKFHGRSQADGVESSMITETSRNMFVQRNVTAVPMLSNAPDGVVCLSL